MNSQSIRLIKKSIFIFSLIWIPVIILFMYFPNNKNQENIIESILAYICSASMLVFFAMLIYIFLKIDKYRLILTDGISKRLSPRTKKYIKKISAYFNSVIGGLSLIILAALIVLLALAIIFISLVSG